MTSTLESTDVKNRLEDLSGLVIQPGENPYEALIKVCKGHPTEIQALYSTHRTARNAQQQAKFLSADYHQLIIDPFLLRLEKPEMEPGFQDPRHCFVFWARPPDHIVKLALRLQALLREAAPSLWLMPPHRMHLTALEVTHSRTPQEIADLVSVARPAIPAITSLTYTRRARLVKPMLSYDLSAIAVSFVPAAGERVQSPPPVAPHPESIVHPGIPDGTTEASDAYTYHHLRRDTFDKVQEAGLEIASRYVVPSAHITLGRYLTHEEHSTPAQRQRWVKTINDINAWLEKDVWDGSSPEYIGEWIVGQERGLDARVGQLWYGGGRTLMTGEGF